MGCESVEECERLAETLRSEIPDLQCLTAKNNELEAEIIKSAGRFGAVTVSANMAGRGVDIMLGSAGDWQVTSDERERVLGAGGLYVICTSLRESSRINAQMNGRAGRQGDIGKSVIYAALDDDLMLRYGLKKLVPEKNYPDYTEEAITDKIVLREAARVQRISEGDRLDERKRLLKFTMIGEKHREAVFKKRSQILRGISPSDEWAKSSEFAALAEKFGEDKLRALEQRVLLWGINPVWSE